MAEAIIVRCGKCQQRLKVVPQSAAIQVKCPKCGTLLRVSGTTATTGPQAPAAAPSRPTPPKPATVPSKSLTQPQRPAATAFDLGDLPLAQSSQPVQQPMMQRPALAGVSSSNQNKSLQQPRKGKTRFPRWILYTLGGIGITFLVCCGGLGLLISRLDRSATPVMPIEIALRAATPPRENFPPLGNPEQQFASGVNSYFISLKEPTLVPGRNMQMRVFVPPGDHADHSLPCVLIAPAGTPLIHGAALEPNDGYTDETLPYAEAGFVVIQYSIDGAADTEHGEPAISEMLQAYEQFKASGAGVVNGRNACEYALSQLKFVDPKRIHCAGHSSAGALALLLAAHEPRINRCVAFAAAYDLESRMKDMTSDITARALFSGIGGFVKLTSPINHVNKFRNPVFVFHARDDSNVPFADAEKFVSQLKAAGKSVTFEQVPTGDHYGPMIDPGIPMAIQWLQQP